MKHLNILYGANDSFAQHTGVSVRSLIANNRDLRLDIVVAGLGFTIDARRKIESLSTAQARVRVVDFDPAKLASMPQIDPYPKDIYIRLWVHEFFDPASGKVLYIDADTVIVGSVRELADLDLGDNILGAVDIPGADSHHRCHLPPQYNYFNSGVLLINNRAWHDEKCLQTVENFLNANIDILHNADQDALNGCFYQRRVTLDYKWNLIAPFYRKNAYAGVLSREELAASLRDERIVHFNGQAKPWYYLPNHPRAGRYREYLAQTPWKDYRFPDKTWFNVLKKWAVLTLDHDSFIR